MDSKEMLKYGNEDAENSASLGTDTAAKQDALAENAGKRRAKLIKLWFVLAMTVIVLVFVSI